MPHRDIVVVGGSAGSLQPLRTFVAALPGDLPAAIFVVQHISPDAPGLLAGLLGHVSLLPVAVAEDRQAIDCGRIYVARPDFHLLVGEGVMMITRGPHENRTRPAIDPLFRSAAAAYGSRVIAVVLSGMLDDGSAGLVAVQRCGGIVVVQQPDDAQFPDMPNSSLAAVQADYCVPASELAELIDRLVREQAAPGFEAPADVVAEARIAERTFSDIHIVDGLGTPAPFGCPECGGPLWEMREEAVRRFRCLTGHAYTARHLLADQSSAMERALWAAVRTLEERTVLLEKMARDAGERGQPRSAETYRERSRQSGADAEQIRQLLVQL